MISRIARPVYRLVLLTAVLSVMSSTALSALDITFNGRNIEVFDTDALGAFAITPPAADVTVLPLSTLYPWLESIEYVEAGSGTNRVYWEGSWLDETVWYEATLQRRNGVWQIHIGEDVFSSPDRITVRGVAMEIDRVTVWSTVPSVSFRSTLESLLALRDIELEWRQADNLKGMLADPPASGLPHLVVTGALDRTVLDSLLTSWHPLSTGSYRWYGVGSTDPAVPGSGALTADAYHPEAALYFAARSGGSVLTDTGLSSELEAYLEWASASRADGALVVTENPVDAVNHGWADLALILPSSSESAMEAVPALTAGDAPISDYLAIPAGLPADRAGTAALLMDALATYLGDPADIVLPDDRLPDFYKAYERVGRLVISGQMSVEDGMALMNLAVKERGADG